MKLGALVSGGKDSLFAAYLAKKSGYKLTCLLSIVSKNPESYMFHTPSISQVSKQAQRMNLPLVSCETLGEKEKELEDLKECISQAIEKHGIEGLVTGAVESVYQATRIQKICHDLGIECFNPLWQKNQTELLEDLLTNGFEVILTAVAAEPLDKSWLGKKIDRQFIESIKTLEEKYSINPAGEGGEFESFVLNCPLFSEPLVIESQHIIRSGQQYRLEVNAL